MKFSSILQNRYALKYKLHYNIVPTSISDKYIISYFGVKNDFGGRFWNDASQNEVEWIGMYKPLYGNQDFNHWPMWFTLW